MLYVESLCVTFFLQLYIYIIETTLLKLNCATKTSIIITIFQVRFKDYTTIDEIKYIFNLNEEVQ